jgi:Cu+-exporting ATPase
MHQFDIPLAGLNCMGCARKVEKALVGEHGVTIESLSPSQVILNTDANFANIESSIIDLGYLAGNHDHFYLSGLNCNKCINKITQALENHPEVGVFSVTKTELSISSLLSQSEIQSIITSLGFHATYEPISNDEAPQAEKVVTDKNDLSESKLTSQQLIISGMTCASCVSSVEKALLSVKGVVRAQINLAEQTALVFTSNLNSQLEKETIQSIAQAGYQAEFVLDQEQQQTKVREQQSATQTKYKRSAWLGMMVGTPLMAWGLLGGNMMIRSSQDQIAWGLIGALCFWLLATAGRSFFSNAWQAFTHKRATMDTLVALGTGSAWFYSMLVVLFPTWFPQASRHVYFEASAMIIGLISLGHFIEAKAKAKTTLSLQSLVDLQPSDATQITKHGEKQIDIRAIEIGMKLRIKPGEKVPVDGKVLSGESYIDESMLTGEPVPTLHNVGSRVAAGTLNQDGSLVIEATGIGSNTMLARIITMVREAQSSKPEIAKLADKISSVFVPVVVAIALFAGAVWFVVGPDPKASYTLIVVTTVLIIACPCALGLATPLSVTVGVGKAAEMGILIKDADVLQSASKIDTVVFDKTGTLTLGKPTVQKVWSLNNDEDQLLQMAASLEQLSEHPLAKAVVSAAQLKSLPFSPIENFTNQRGQGVFGTLAEESLSVTSVNYATEQGIVLEDFSAQLQEAQRNAWTPLVVTRQHKVAGVIAVADAIKNDAQSAINTLKAMNITPVMLTGDSLSVANAIAQSLGIDSVIAEVLPDEKASHIEKLQAEGKRVAMIGDGVNDAPALALADIGIAMGSGSDVAIESAQMTILNSSPLAVAKAIELSKATVKNMKQNLFGAFIYNSLGIPIAAGVLFPAFGFLLSPVVAGAAMALSSITVVSNANRLRLFNSTIQS